MQLKYIRIQQQPTHRNEWGNSTLRHSLDTTIRLNKQPHSSRILGGLLQQHHQGSTQNNYQTKSIFATNLPTSSHRNFRSKSTVKKRVQLGEERGMGEERNQRMEENVMSWFAPARTQSEKKIRLANEREVASGMKYKKISQSKLREMVLEGKRVGGRVINVFNIAKNGLRFDLKQSYFIVENQNSKANAANDLKGKIKTTLELDNKKVYLFHLNREPISRMIEIHFSEYSIFADSSPRLEIPLYLYTELNEKIKQLEQSIKHQQGLIPKDQLGEDNIVDISLYADQLVQNPGIHIIIPQKVSKHLSAKSQQFTNIIRWYDNGISDYNRKIKESSNSKIPVPMDQRSNQPLLKQTRLKLEQFPYIINPHKKKLTVDEIREKEYQMKNKSKSISKISEYINGMKSSKEIGRELNIKHTLLSEQNIPYLIEKYNISRNDVHELYSLYKSLAQVSAKRIKSTSKLTIERGIDKNTFNEGLIGMGHNVGKEVIKTVCNFEDYVSWPEFLKIVSISLSKTPEEKLESILKYVSEDSNCDYLNKMQVDIMVSTCLSKFLGKTQEVDFIEMKEYLLETIFKQLDPQNLNQINIEVLKKRVLTDSKESDLISFLFLYAD